MAFWDKFRKKPHGKKKEIKGAQVAAPKVETAKMTRNKPEDTGLAHRILVRAFQSEKAARLGGSNQYVFEITPNANKLQVKEAVFRVYGVRPKSVNIVSLPGKLVRYGRTTGRENITKKAIVTLPAGKTISIYEGV